MRKLLILALSIIMLVTLSVTGCTKTGSDSSTPTANTQEKFTLKMAHVVRPTTPKGMAADKFKELIEERSNGRIEVVVYADSQMGNDQEINEQLLAGTLDMCAPFFPTLTSMVDEFQLFDLPYLFTDRESAFKALHGEVGDQFSELLSSKGFVCLGFWTGGFKQFTNSVRPIESVEDLDGLKMRVSQSPGLVNQYRAINAGGISIPFKELYTALQTKTVDGQENPLANIASKKFYEVQDYMTISNHGFMGYAFMISKAKFDTLPEDLQKLVKEVALEVNKWQWDKTFEKEEDYLKQIKDAGVTVSEFDDKDIKEYLDATHNVYDDFVKNDSGKKLIEIVNKYK